VAIFELGFLKLVTLLFVGFLFILFALRALRRADDAYMILGEIYTP